MARSYTIGKDVPSSPARVNGVVYVGSYALNAATGAKLWSFSARGFIEFSQAVTYRIVYADSNDGYLPINNTTGRRVWSYNEGNGSYLTSSPVVVNNTAYVNFADGNIFALNATTGAIL